MIRTLVTPKQADISIHLPAAFIGKKVEVIAFTVEEAIDSAIEGQSPITHFASQQVLAKDWLSPEEESAWKDL